MPANRLADDLFSAAVSIHFRRIDNRQAKIDARAQCSCLLARAAPGFHPYTSPLPDNGNRRMLAKTNGPFYHRYLLQMIAPP